MVSFTPRSLYPRYPFDRRLRGWVDPRDGLDDVEKRKFLTLLGLERWPLGPPAHNQSLYRLLSASSLSFSLTLRMEAVRSFEILMNSYQLHGNISQKIVLCCHWCGNLKSNVYFITLSLITSVLDDGDSLWNVRFLFCVNITNSLKRISLES
jgi:hypothetical protein